MSRWSDIGVTGSSSPPNTSTGQTARAIEHMRALHALTNDPETRANIERRLASLESASEAEAMHLLATDLERRHRAQFPYVNEALFILLAPRIDTRVEP